MENIRITCERCGKTYQVKLNKADLERWTSGEGTIQQCLPYLSCADRELIMSHTCNECFEQMFR